MSEGGKREINTRFPLSRRSRIENLLPLEPIECRSLDERKLDVLTAFEFVVNADPGRVQRAGTNASEPGGERIKNYSSIYSSNVDTISNSDPRNI